MQGIGSQLSKNVLGMKFMRKTREEFDKVLLEEKHRQHFTPESILLNNSKTATANTIETVIAEVPSYSQIIGYRFARVSFGGFNPVVEENVQKGKWTPVRVHSPEKDDEDSDLELTRIKSEPDDTIKEEPVYGSLIATCGKQFQKRNTKEDDDNEEEEEDVPLPRKARRGWVTRGFRAQKPNKNERHDDRRGRKKKNNGQPPAKRPRFVKR